MIRRGAVFREGKPYSLGNFTWGCRIPCVTGIHQYFSPTTPIPSRKDTGIGALVTREANGSVRRVLEKQVRQQSAKKRKGYANFSDTDRAEIGQYAAIIVTTRSKNWGGS